MAATVGLKINQGKGKTERFIVTTSPDDPPKPLRTKDGAEIPLVDDYKYLGIHVLSFQKDFRARKGKAWAAMKSLDRIWKSNATAETKRKLFAALVEPIFTYGLCVWPLTITQRDLIDASYGRMLRYAMDIAPAYLSHDEWPSERLYGDLKFISTQVVTRRCKMVLHYVRQAYREVNSRDHPFIDVLMYDPSEDGHTACKGGKRATLRSAILKDYKLGKPSYNSPKKREST
jgi:hypothetical protein